MLISRNRLFSALKYSCNESFHGTKRYRFIHSEPTTKVQVGILGIKDDSRSSFLRGPSQAPPVIRAAMYSESSNSYSETGVNVFQAGLNPTTMDFGDITEREVSPGTTISKLHEILDEGLKPLVLGGDHSISYPVIETLLNWRIKNMDDPSFTILHLDAHPDLYDELGGDRLSHACPFARIMELNEFHEKDYINLVQVGIRTATSPQREQMDRFKIRLLEMKDFPDSKAELKEIIQESLSEKKSTGDVYISFDMDVLDPAFAIGVSHYEPGGMTTRQATDTLLAIPSEANIIGCDCVEYNPTRDINNSTAMVAAKICKELISLMLK
mmetsp:Transcript_16922/g.19217  ORF Transcript_16922/g.19217 Transcript_16922/m.19217 type:complete len:326 (-) Transcript_16922:503-1480(-)